MGRAQLSLQMSLTFILKATGRSELGSYGIKLVFIEDQFGWALGEDILEQSELGTWRGTGTEGQRDGVYVSRSLTPGDDVIAPSTLQRMLSPARLQGPCLTPMQKIGGNITRGWRISQGPRGQGNSTASFLLLLPRDPGPSSE